MTLWIGQWRRRRQNLGLVSTWLLPCAQVIYDQNVFFLITERLTCDFLPQYTMTFYSFCPLSILAFSTVRSEHFCAQHLDWWIHQNIAIIDLIRLARSVRKCKSGKECKAALNLPVKRWFRQWIFSQTMQVFFSVMTGLSLLRNGRTN